MVGFDTAGIYLADPTTGSLKLVAHIGLQPALVEALEKTAWDRPPGLAMKADEPLVYEDLWSDLRARISDSQWQRLADLRARQKRVRSALWVPIRTSDRSLGALGVGRHEWRSFSPDEERIVSTLANEIAIGALQQRSSVHLDTPTVATRVQYGPLLVDLAGRSVEKDGKLVRLTAREFDLLACLVREAGAVVTREKLLTAVWGPDHRDDAQYLHVYVGRLRRKIGDSVGDARLIVTAHGVGYSFRPTADSDSSE